MDQQSNHDQENQQAFRQMTEIIRRLHNQQQIPTINGFGSNLQQNTFTNVLRLAYNKSLSQFNKENNYVYFQQPQFIINQDLRIIGELTQTLAALCQFQGLSQSLATFNTNQFLENIDSQLQCYVKGIYPRFNVHIDNVPLYVPTFSICQSYQAIGNPLWQSSRQMLQKIVLKKVISSEGETPQWYRLLTGDLTLINQAFARGSIYRIWINLYLYYMEQTLKPYRQNSTARKGQQTLKLISNMILQLINEQSNYQNRIIITLVAYIITGKWQLLRPFAHKYESIIEQDFRVFQSTLENFQNDKSNEISESRIVCTGLSTTILYQIIKNIQEAQSGKANVQDYTKSQLRLLEDIRLNLKEKNTKFVELNVPFYDFFSRIFYPGQSYQEEAHIRQIMSAKIMEGRPLMRFPLQCQLFSDGTYQTLGELYLQKYPSQITQVLGHLNNENAVWRLFNTTALQNPQSFRTINQQLRVNQDEFRKIIQQTIEISKDDYTNFIKIWQEYHTFLSKVSNSTLSSLQGFKLAYSVLKRVDSSQDIRPPFLEKITLPMDDNQRLQNVLDYYTTKLISYVDHSKSKSQNIQKYLQIIHQDFFKNKILKRLSSQKITLFWQQWSDILLADEHLVQDLIMGPLNNKNLLLGQSSIQHRQSSIQNNQIELQ